ncbi:MAG TPA: lamin tail domain-containing protein, partial [Candidatus Acidoferrum sp.]|nr:lamin tail domain-containing protein [Candidatus Acidoferrum sp.]
PDFTQKIIDRWGQLRTNVFALSNLITRVESITNRLNEAKDREHTRWPRLNTYVWPNPDGPNLTTADAVTLNWNVNYAINNTYGQLIGEMKKWVVGRYAWVDAQYTLPPALSLPSGPITPGAVLSITGPIGTIYYTVNGTDPRGSNGVVTAAARIYSGPITLTNNAGIFARVLNGANWTAPARGVYVVSTPSLRVSEIMYHPADPAVDSLYLEEDFEFIEIQNTGTNSINLSGAQLGGGVQFTFGSNTLAPGQFAVVVRNVAGFQSRYGSGIPVAGTFTGKLNNAGDHLVLTGPVGEPILDFDYGDGWYPITDGLGFSLVARDSSAAVGVWGNSTAWRAASLLGGSPGAADPLLAIAPIVVNEILANSVTPAVDWIELYNPLPTNVNIGGWYLTDDFGSPKKFRIVNGTEILANSRIVFTEADFNPNPLDTNSFSLSSAGDEVFLFSADLAGNLTGYADGFDFGASDEGVTFGRFMASDGSIDYPALAAPTLGNPNAAPIVGPIVISEIMYRPPDMQGLDNDIDEFIELKNISGSTVPLFSAALPHQTWRLRNGVDFDFPTNASLAPNEIVVVVSFSPTNAEALAAFRSTYSVGPQVAIFGPFIGKLDNSGERIELYRPGQLGTNGVPYLMAEKVTYSDDLPWNGAADGFGPSLHRLMPAGYGNDPINWTAASPTPGAAQPAGEAPVITQQPANIIIVSGANTNLSVAAQGNALQFQWRFEGTDIPGATSAILALPNINVTHQGEYRVAVFNNSGAVLSDSAAVTVRSLPVITSHPISQTNNPGSNTVFSTFATGTGIMTYQWRTNGIDIPGATNTILAIPNAQLYQNAGIYDVIATDEIGSAASAPAFLVIRVLPFLAAPGGPYTVLQGGTIVFTMSAGPVHPLLPMSMRWLPNPANMGSVTNVTTTYYTNDYLVMTNCFTNGFVRLVLQNPVGTLNITTTNAGAPWLTVLADFDRDGVADAWEANYGMNTNNAADATLDPDADGMKNRDEYVAGTNPTNALSLLKLSLMETSSGALQFTAQSNISYSIQVRTNLNTGWQTWSNVNASNAVRAIDFSEAMTNRERFFRVVTPKTP